MKKLWIALIIVIFNSCDTRVDYDYYIINKCNEKIEVQIFDYKNKVHYLNVYPNDNQLIFQENAINKIQKELVEYFFKDIVITKENNTSKINYVNKNLWEMRPTSDAHANVFLTVTENDFK